MTSESRKIARKFIGITGTFASGKDTIVSIAERLYPNGRVAYFSTSDMVRAETSKRGLSLERSNLQVVANELRSTLGPGILGKLCFDAAQQLPQSTDIILVGGIRNPGEVQALRERAGDNFVLWAVDAPIEIRYARVKARARAGEQLLSFEEFRASEEKEKQSANAAGQNIPACMALADELIINDGIVAALEAKVAKLFSALLG